MITHWIAGKAHEGHTVSAGDVYDPSTGQVVDRVGFATVGDVDDAVADALEAFGEWHASSLMARTQILFTYRELLSRRADDLARMVSRQHGKTFADAGDVLSAALNTVRLREVWRSSSSHVVFHTSSRVTSRRTCPATSTR